jgi:hypothetical protein
MQDHLLEVHSTPFVDDVHGEGFQKHVFGCVPSNDIPVQHIFSSEGYFSTKMCSQEKMFQYNILIQQGYPSTKYSLSRNILVQKYSARKRCVPVQKFNP